MPAGLVVGGWFASAVIGKLIDMAKTYLSDKYEYWTGFKDRLEQLTKDLIHIQAALDAAEGWQIESWSLVAWMHELKDAVYNAEDVLDRFDHQVIEYQVESSQTQKCHKLGSYDMQESSSALVPISRAIFKPSIVSVRRLIFHKDNLNELESIMKRFNRIATNMGDFINLIDLNMKQPNRTMKEVRETSSFLTEHKVYGREEEKNKIIELITKTNDSTNKNISVLPIIGVGGVGKTTLAQLIYNDQRVENYLRMWICVCDNFDVKRLTREILESASIDGNPGAFTNFNVLQNNAKKCLNNSKKFLLVLDDVWNDEDRSSWEKLCALLEFGQKGSKVLITTRSDKVAKMMGTMEPINLEGLPVKDYMLFFNKCAFGDEDPDRYPELLRIGNKIAEKLKGSPLAAKTVAAVLSSELDDDHWMNILRSDLWELPQGPDDIMPALRLSYRHLSPHLKQCFAYCSLFPKDYRFDDEKLVHLWMAQGFIAHTHRDKSMEEIGREYLVSMLHKSFFQLLSYDNKTYYVMHDLMHDLAQSVSVDECARIESNEPRKIQKTIRHLSICVDNPPDFSQMCELSKLRTLVLLCEFDRKFFYDDDDRILYRILKDLKSVRVLDFSECNIPSLPDISNLVHLRYLDVSNRAHLQGSISQLHHLRALRFCAMSSVGYIKGLNNLINLRHLKGNCVDLSGIGALTSLQELDLFRVQKRGGYKIEELKNMNQLHGRLCIEGLENVQSREEALDASLCTKAHLKKLRLVWYGQKHNNSDVVLDALKPHSHLKELEISNYGGTLSPSWLTKESHQNLQSLHLSNCRNWQYLASIAHFCFLKVLRIERMNIVIKYEEKIVFPSLEEIVLEKASVLYENASGRKTNHFFRRLRKIYIRECPINMEFPPLYFNSSLLDLSVDSAGSELIECLGDFTSLISLKILRCHYLSSLPEEAICSLKALESLHIVNCRALSSIGGLESLASLKEFEIVRCPNIKLSSSLCKQEFGMSSLTRLSIGHCSLLTGPILNKKLKSLKILMLSSLDLIKFTEDQDCWFQHLSSLQQLSFSDCKSLESLPSELKSLSSLRQLHISYCPRIQSLPEEGLPAELEELYISGCNVLEERCKKKVGADWHKIKLIPSINIRS